MQTTSQKVIIDHPQSGVVYNLIVSVCLYVNFQKSWLRKFIFAHGLRVELVYEGHRAKVMVMGTKKIGNKSHSTKRTTIMLACSEHGELPYIIRQSCYYLMLLAFNIGGGERAPFPSLCSVVRLSVSRQSPCPHVHGVRHKHGMSHQYSHRQRSCYGYRHGKHLLVSNDFGYLLVSNNFGYYSVVPFQYQIQSNNATAEHFLQSCTTSCLPPEYMALALLFGFIQYYRVIAVWLPMQWCTLLLLLYMCYCLGVNKPYVFHYVCIGICNVCIGDPSTSRAQCSCSHLSPTSQDKTNRQQV